MASLFADFRYAVRVLLKSPAFSAVAVTALALGIGANTAIFSVVNAVLLQPLPYPEPERLIRGCRQYPSGLACNASIPKFLTWSRAQSFESIAAYDFAGPGLNLEGGERPEQVRGIHVTAGYFRVFGVAAAIGRTFTAEEDRPGGPPVAVLAHGLWNTRFGRDTSIAGRAITLNGEPFTVVGVLAEGFHPNPPADVFIPLQADPNTTNQGHFLMVGARLKAGMSIETARAEMKLLGDQFRRENPRWMSSDEQATVEPMKDADVSDARPALLILLGAVGMVLLIACANVANLLLVRAAGRQKEVAIRAAVGAGRVDIIRQLLAESALLAFVAAAIGLLVGVWGAQGLLALAPGNLPRADVLARTPLLETVLDWRLLTFTLAISLVTGLLFGLAPALHLARANLGQALKEGGGRGSTSVHVARVRGTLVVAEVALALVLLVGATLLIRTFASLRAVEPGFDARNVLTLQTSLAGAKYATTSAVHRLTEEIGRRLEAIPGVESTALAISLPTEGGPDLLFRIEGRPLQGDATVHGDEQWRVVSHGYFPTLRIPLVRGRLFDERDTSASAPVVLVNAAFAKKYWPDGDALGQRLTIGGGLGSVFDDPTREIVGVVGDVRELGLDAAPPPVIYVPSPQLQDALMRFGSSVVPWTWLVRTHTDPGPATAAIQQAFLAGASLPVSQVRTMEQVIARSIARQNFNMLLLSVFGAIALALAAIGIYGLMSYSVEQSTHDIGVRLALGAARGDIVSMVLGRGMRLAGIGVVVGLVAAFGASRVVRTLLFGVRPTDPATFVAVAAALAAVAAVACYVPARRATRVDPLIALRSE